MGSRVFRVLSLHQRLLESMVLIPAIQSLWLSEDKLQVLAKVFPPPSSRLYSSIDVLIYQPTLTTITFHATRKQVTLPLLPMNST